MRKYAFFAAAAAALLAVSCSVEPVDVQVDPADEGVLTYLEAGFDGEDGETRTVRQGNGKVFWSPGDEIAVLRGTSGKSRFTATNTEPAARTVFSGTMPSGSSSYWAVYPYSDDVYFDGSYVVCTLPGEQDAVAGSFADGLFFSAVYARNSATSLTFIHQCGGVKFSVTQPGIKKVTLIPADADVYPAGLFGIYAASATSRPYIRVVGYPEYMSGTIDLLAPEGETLQVGAAYHFVTIPVTFNGGFSLIFEKEDGTVAVRNVRKDVTVQAGHFATLMEADKGLSFEDFFRFSPESVSVDAQGGMFAIEVQGTYDYHIDSYSDWIREASASGNVLAGRRHTYYAAQNTGQERTGMLSVCYGDNCYPVLVTQSAAGELDFIPHHALGMRFTATWCQYCPIMDETFHKARNMMGNAFEYVCIYANSGNYGFAGSDGLTTFYQLGGYPSGILDGRINLPNYNSTDYGAEVISQTAAETMKTYGTVTSLGIESSLSGRNLSVKVDVKALYKEDYKLTVFLCENGIVGNQQNGPTVVPDFNHSRVTRMSLTSYTGDAFEGPEAGGVKSFNYSVEVPTNYNLDNMEIVAFVQRSFGARPVIQSASYGDWYVDNARAAALGETVTPEF